MPAGLGVTVFFFLSGYLITTLLRVEFQRYGTISFRAFYTRRALRLFPTLYIVLGVAVALTLAGVFGVQHLRVSAVLSQFFYLSNYQILHSGWSGLGTGRPPGTGDLWSLAVEEHFYLLFPVFYLLLCRYVPSPRKQIAILGAICAAVLAWRVILMVGLGASFDRTYAGTDTRIDSILFGCMLAIWGNPFLDRRASPEAATRGPRQPLRALAALGLLVLLVVYLMPGDTDRRIMGTIPYTLQGLALIPLFMVAVSHSRWGLVRFLNLRSVRYIGVLSYTIYVVEQIVIYGIGIHLKAPHIVKGIAYLVATLAIAAAIHHFVEVPIARLRRRFSRVTPVEAAAREDAAAVERRALPAAASAPVSVEAVAAGG